MKEITELLSKNVSFLNGGSPRQTVIDIKGGKNDFGGNGVSSPNIFRELTKDLSRNKRGRRDTKGKGFIESPQFSHYFLFVESGESLFPEPAVLFPETSWKCLL